MPEFVFECVCLCVWYRSQSINNGKRWVPHERFTTSAAPVSLFSLHPSIFSLFLCSHSLHLLLSFAVFLHSVHSDSVEIFGPYPTHPFIPSAHLTFYFLHHFLSVSISQLLCPWKFELCSKFSSLFILTCFYSFTPPRFYFPRFCEKVDFNIGNQKYTTGGQSCIIPLWH